MAKVVHAPPSAASATDLVRGEPGALATAVAHTAVRTVLIASGMTVAGAGGRGMWRHALAGALALEVFLIGYAVHREARGTSSRL
jgi:hypothetical protein